MRDALVFTGYAFRDARARELAVAAARAGWLGRMARGLSLFGLLDDIYDRQEEVELPIYRAHHARAATAASPLALDLLAHEGVDVGGIVSGLRAHAEWRRWVCGRSPPISGPLGRWSVGAPRFRPEDADEIDLFLHGCHVVRGWSDPSGALGIRLSPAGLEIGARIGPVHLHTIAGVATLSTTGPILPATIRNAVVGLPVEAVFDHPVLHGRGYVIGDQYERVPTVGDPREAWRIKFRAEPVQWTPRWAASGTDDGGDHDRARALRATSHEPRAGIKEMTDEHGR